MIKMNDVISIIILDNETGRLKRLVYDCELDRYPSDSELRRAFDFCAGATSVFSSSLPSLSPRHPMRDADDRRLALAHEQTMRRIKSLHSHILAFSHRQGGWKTFTWQFNSDIVFKVRTNFGYGSSSYFFLLTLYKGYQLTPYSYYVRYRYAGVADICRYTCSYPVRYSAWHEAMTDAVEFYNAVVLKQDVHVLDWIKRHLNDMLNGLQSFLNNNDGFSLNNFVEYRDDTLVRVTGDDWFILKTEKISGSLQFVSNMRALPAEVPVDGYITRLVEINRLFMPQLRDKIVVLADKVRRLRLQLAEESSCDHYPLYQMLDKKYWVRMQFYTDTGRMKTIRLLMRIYRRKYPGYDYAALRQDIERLKARIDSVNRIKTALSGAESLHGFLRKAEEKITGYLKDFNAGA